MEAKKTSGQLELERLRQKNKIVITDLSVCYHCKRPNLNEDEVYCPNCGFAQRGTETEQRKFIASYNVSKRFEEDYKKAINKARNILYILCGLNVLSGILLGVVINKDVATLISCLLLAAIYLGLALWCKSKPFPAIITGLIVYITFIVIAAMLNPISIVSGIFWKVAIISGFVYGYRGAKEGESLKEQMELKEAGVTSL